MSRQLLVAMSVMVALVSGILRGQSALEIRAAASSPVSGWQQMASPDGGPPIWVSPANHATSADIARAVESRRADGGRAVSFVFTDEGAKKMAQLSAAQIGKPIVMLLDGKVIWAPILRSGIEKEALLTGGPGGLTQDQVQHLLAAVARR